MTYGAVQALLVLSSSPYRCGKSLGFASSPFLILRRFPDNLTLVKSRWISTATMRRPTARSEQSTTHSLRESMAPGDSDANTGLQSFETLRGKIRPETFKAITISPFQHTHMTPVQAAVLSLLPELAQPRSINPVSNPSPRDVLVRAKTGTGKTLAFLVPAIEARVNAIEAAGKHALQDAVGTLIISPTRELATQIAVEAQKLSHHHRFGVRLFVGGNSKKTQMREWMQGRRDIVVATPGRMMDVLQSEPDVKKSIQRTQILVLDEADTLLDMGFRDDLEQITACLSPAPQRQTFLFSATVSPAIRQIARTILDKGHQYVDTIPETTSPVHAHIPQFHTVLPSAKEQIPHILRLIAHDQLYNSYKSKVMVFLPTTKLTQLFANLLRQLSSTCLPARHQTNIYEIHSLRNQLSRTKASDAFRRDKSGSAILVSSDISARGVDYPGVSRVIQVGIPGSTEQYIHRIGRTGRAGNTLGRGDLVLLPWEIGFLRSCLQNLPLKPISHNELEAEIATLAEKLGEASLPIKRNHGGFYSSTRRQPLLDIVTGIPTAVQHLLTTLHRDVVSETFASLLGFYTSKSNELRIPKSDIVNGLKTWAVEACGLSTPPYVSPDFLQRMGITSGHSNGEASYRRNVDRYRRTDGPKWTGRGHQNRRVPARTDFRNVRSSRTPFGDDSRNYSRLRV